MQRLQVECSSQMFKLNVKAKHFMFGPKLKDCLMRFSYFDLFRRQAGPTTQLTI